jgi:hypothetical protein
VGRCRLAEGDGLPPPGVGERLGRRRSSEKEPIDVSRCRGREGRANDAWWKPVVETHLTEARWVRAIEIRPSTVKGRKITHHAIARLQQQETDALAVNPPDANGNPLPGTFMEWAVGKQGEMMRPNSGKLMLPGPVV